MKWMIAKPEKDLTQWHPYFAWMPVTIGPCKHWLCLVNRRAIKTTGDDPNGQIQWEYEEAVWYP